MHHELSGKKTNGILVGQFLDAEHNSYKVANVANFREHISDYFL